MDRRTFCRVVTNTLMVCALAITFASRAQAAEHADADSIDPLDAPVENPATDVRAGGVLSESFRYHRPGFDEPHSLGSIAPHATIAPADGWYGYGFPVKTYRWGWFGAGRYYPRVVWHRGYYGDCCRWAYRHGY